MLRQGLARILFGPDTGYPVSGCILKMARYPANYWISGRITVYTALEISHKSGISIVSITGYFQYPVSGRISGKPDN